MQRGVGDIALVRSKSVAPVAQLVRLFNSDGLVYASVKDAKARRAGTTHENLILRGKVELEDKWGKWRERGGRGRIENVKMTAVVHL